MHHHHHKIITMMTSNLVVATSLFRNPPLLPSFFNRINGTRLYLSTTINSAASAAAATGSNKGQAAKDAEEEFKPLDIIQSKAMQRGQRRKRRERKDVPPPRYLKMPVDQDWGSVWPVARTFHPASVPLPLHQGYVTNKGQSAPNKFGNLELMKIPNFLHLTPPVIARHCAAIKKFCTPWPKELENDQVLDALFPIEVTTNDYCHSLPSIRDIRARIVNLQIKVSSLNLDYHAKDKLQRLVGELYDKKSDVLTITAECCPLRQQNFDYAIYLLTALYHESCNKEPWEDEKSESDMEKYVWEGSASQKTIESLLGLNKDASSTSQLDGYKDAISNLLNGGEDTKALEEYGKSVRQLLNLPTSSNSS